MCYVEQHTYTYTWRATVGSVVECSLRVDGTTTMPVPVSRNRILCQENTQHLYQALRRWIGPDWEGIRIERVLRLKFSRNPDVKALLLSTGDVELLLDAPIPWCGVVTNGSERNKLGKALMKLREEFRIEQNRHSLNDCLICGAVAESHFCSGLCTWKAVRNAPQLIQIHCGHDTFKNVAKQFEASWRHTESCPTVHQVYKIIAEPLSTVEYEAYRKSVESRGNFVAHGLSAGNERRRWHGTTRKCLLGDNGNTTLCSLDSCSLCGIIRTSYKLACFGKKTKWGRFGKGIYTSSISSKSNGYSKNGQYSNYKAILLNRVVVGKGCKMLRNRPALTAPPHGHDSVLGEPSEGRGRLKYDELVCYTESAIRPSYLLIYDNPDGIEKKDRDKHHHGDKEEGKYGEEYGGEYDEAYDEEYEYSS